MYFMSFELANVLRCERMFHSRLIGAQQWPLVIYTVLLHTFFSVMGKKLDELLKSIDNLKST